MHATDSMGQSRGRPSASPRSCSRQIQCAEASREANQPFQETRGRLE